MVRELVVMSPGVAWAFNGWKSITRLGSPFDFPTIIILWHQVSGANGDFLYDSEVDVTVQVLLHLAFPVHRQKLPCELGQVWPLWLLAFSDGP